MKFGGKFMRLALLKFLQMFGGSTFNLPAASIPDAALSSNVALKSGLVVVQAPTPTTLFAEADVSSNSTTFVDTGITTLTATITPTSASNKIRIRFFTPLAYNSAVGFDGVVVGIKCNINGGGANLIAFQGCTSNQLCAMCGPTTTGASMSLEIYHAPATTLATVYSVFFRSINGGTVKLLDHTSQVVADALTLSVEEIKG